MTETFESRTSRTPARWSRSRVRRSKAIGCGWTCGRVSVRCGPGVRFLHVAKGSAHSPVELFLVKSQERSADRQRWSGRGSAALRLPSLPSSVARWRGAGALFARQQELPRQVLAGDEGEQAENGVREHPTGREKPPEDQTRHRAPRYTGGGGICRRSAGRFRSARSSASSCQKSRWAAARARACAAWVVLISIMVTPQRREDDQSR